MADLPSRASLEYLYNEQGKEAMMWYAWRRALRALPLLAGAPFEEVWDMNFLGYIYSICQVNILLVDRECLPINTVARVVRARDYAQTYATVAAKTAADAKAIANSRAAAIAVAKASKASRVRIAAARTADMVKVATSANVADAIDVLGAVVSASTGVASAARNDFDYLIRHNINRKNWLTIALWPKKSFFGAGKPNNIDILEQALLKQLWQLELGFLAEDIQALWEGRPIDTKRLENYAKDLSDEITNDPVALRKAILGEAEVDKIQAVRCLLLGPGGAGKSSLADRLQGRELETIDEDGTTYVKVKSVTTGVDYLEHQPLKLAEHFEACDLGEQPLDLYLWDFGGQTIFHGLHSAFLHENCVYVLVVDSRHEQAPDEWLYQIEHLAGSARVLLVTNWYENCESRQNETRLLRKFPNLLLPDSFFYFSCHEPNPKAFKAFVESLVRNAFASQVASFAEELEIWRDLSDEFEKQVFMDGCDVDDFIEERIEQATVADVRKRFQGLGFLVEVIKGKEFYCLSPSWAVDNAYQLLHSEPLRKVREQSDDIAGMTDLPSLKRVLRKNLKVKPEHTAYLVDFLTNRRLCCELKNNKGYFFPDAASADEPEIVKTLVSQEESLTIRFDLPYLPLGFHAGMVSRLFQTNKPVAIRQPTDIWRQGFILHGDCDRAKAVVSYQMRKSTIGLVLVGEDLAEAANILETFRVALHEVLGVGKSGIEEAHLQPFVVWNKWASTLLSGSELISLLGSTGSYGELVEKIKQLENEVKEAMASKYNISVGDNSQVAVDAKGVTQQHQSNNVEVTADQREQIALMAGALLENFKDLKPEELTAVAVVNQALEEPEEEQSQKLLGTVANGLDKTVGFANNAVGVGEFVAKNWGAITAAFTAAAAVIS